MNILINNKKIAVEDKRDRSRGCDYLESTDGSTWYYDKWNGERYLDCWTYDEELNPVDLGQLEPVYHISTDDDGDMQTEITGYKLV